MKDAESEYKVAVYLGSSSKLRIIGIPDSW